MGVWPENKSALIYGPIARAKPPAHGVFQPARDESFGEFLRSAENNWVSHRRLCNPLYACLTAIASILSSASVTQNNFATYLALDDYEGQPAPSRNMSEAGPEFMDIRATRLLACFGEKAFR